MMNFTGMLSSKQRYRCLMKRKDCLNANQSQRQRVVEVMASDWREAKQQAEKIHREFKVEGQPREIR